jgi:hypothetical protein
MSDHPHLDLIRSTLKNNQRQAGEFFYTVPSDTAYPYQWLWDSCFNALIYSHYQPELAEREITSLLSQQWDNGMVPHVIYWEKDHDVYPIDWGTERTSALIQPPIIAYSAWRVYQVTQNKTWLKSIYPALVKWHKYLQTDRQLPGRHLFGLVNPDESGEDNSPRFDSSLNLPPQHDIAENQKRRFALFAVHRQYNNQANQGTHQHFWVEDIPFNVFAIESLRAMSSISSELGLAGEEYLTEADLVITDMRKYCFADGSFWSFDGVNQSLIKVDTWAKFAPLFAGLYTDIEAEELIKNHWFSSNYELESVSSSDPAYDASEPKFGKPWQHPHWRGPIWMAVNWCVYHGLKRYGYEAEAKRLAIMSNELIAKSKLREYYHPQTGAGMGADRFTWGGLVLDMK